MRTIISSPSADERAGRKLIAASVSFVRRNGTVTEHKGTDRTIKLGKQRILTQARAIAGLLVALSAVAASAQMPLNTGFDYYSSFGPFTAPSTSTSTTQDPYWVNIATYPPTTPTVGPTFVLQTPSGWQPPLPSLPASNWIGPRSTANSGAGVTAQLPGYTIYRKCFCLHDFSAPSISFTLRADDTVQVWLNSQTNVLLHPQLGNWFTTPVTSLPSSPTWFRSGTNCLYALVEDVGGITGFDLNGTVTVTGPAPIPAFGTTPTYPCGCPPPSVNATPVEVATAHDDSEVVTALIQIAEERRLQRTAFPRRGR